MSKCAPMLLFKACQFLCNYEIQFQRNSSLCPLGIEEPPDLWLVRNSDIFYLLIRRLKQSFCIVHACRTWIRPRPCCTAEIFFPQSHGCISHRLGTSDDFGSASSTEKSCKPNLLDDFCFNNLLIFFVVHSGRCLWWTDLKSTRSATSVFLDWAAWEPSPLEKTFGGFIGIRFLFFLGFG